MSKTGEHRKQTWQQYEPYSVYCIRLMLSIQFKNCVFVLTIMGIKPSLETNLYSPSTPECPWSLKLSFRTKLYQFRQICTILWVSLMGTNTNWCWMHQHQLVLVHPTPDKTQAKFKNGRYVKTAHPLIVCHSTSCSSL